MPHGDSIPGPLVPLADEYAHKTTVKILINDTNQAWLVSRSTSSVLWCLVAN